MNKLFAALVVIILIVLGLYLYDHQQQGVGAVASSTNATSSAASTKSIKEDTSTYTIDATYPVTSVAAADTKIKNDIDKAIEEFKTYPANPPDSAVPQNQFNADPGGVYIGPDIVSVALQISEYTGGAHPNTVIDAVNIDRKTGAELSLQDALGLTGLSLAQIASSSLSQLQKQYGDAVFEDGVLPKPENYQTFLINKDSVTFVFQEYQAAPYAAGIPEIAFPRAK
jgi:hypothetical protein